ncbi:MAG TPA: NlpC/P60 family N-terminal domain-containing protein [Geobacteraceae bacterium]|nr:NlpC/P60 family N-terminal domain-containing protein [Geobacteraceae bacterium]
MNHPAVRAMVRRGAATGIICTVLALLGGCNLPIGKRPAPRDQEIDDVLRLPQDIAHYAGAAGVRLALGDDCRAVLLDEFRTRYFAPWTHAAPQYDPAETKEQMRKTARGSWYGVNRRIMAPEMMRELLDNCALESFPSRNETAIAVAPAHLRELPTRLPLFTKQDGYPFDMLQYPNVKLNEPLRVLHASQDGTWLFVENAYSAGWLEARDVALADQGFIDSWMERPQLVIVRDYASVADARWGIVHRAKIGTILPLATAGDGWWEAVVASAGKQRRAISTVARLPREAAARFPLAFNREDVALIGNQLLGQPYGWGEMYGLRDCSAMLRDFFLPFGIWLPRTAADQIASARQRRDLAGLAPREKEETISREGLPFLTLFYKPGHIMLYVGTDPQGRPLVFHNAWSIRVKDATGERTQFIGKAVITTLEPGKELGLAEGGALLEQGTALATITDRCAGAPTPSAYYDVIMVDTGQP